ncbi:4Fe-4S binding protein [Shewanella fodinae]|uniref:4Fe-4S binding protein n=1 Tax=Shewanella fodinae TaxID=552357 RepID=UPI0016788D2B|nr:4Fe-4S binding protein [Shewanella fodinae]MCL2906082.1 4Fe-4S binding protein [Shewanella fodinae]GGY98289.1 iron-sulfur cluster-binding protein [Shewanella fodinae]
MTITESVTLMLALLYGASQLWWAGKRYGAVAATVSLLIALAISASPVLLAGTLLAIAGLALLQWRKPALAKGDVRINELRAACQHFIALALLIVAVQYTINSLMLKAGMTPVVSRPNVVDAFLPIAGAIEVKGIVSLGLWDQTHPAAAIMLGIVLLTGILCKRAFCGWACPIGLAGEQLYRLRKRFVKEELMPPRWLDWPLRMLKYLLLAAFIYLVVGMPAMGIPGYLQGSYHKIADLKMALFFLTPGLITLCCFALILMIASWRRQGFCRYLCPYGAILGLLSFMSPLKIRRNHSACLLSKGMKCDKCTRACPANIIIHTKTTVRSDECQACMRCVAACPKKEALGFALPGNHAVSARSLMLGVLTIMFFLPLIAWLLGYWDSQTPDAIRMQLLQMIDHVGH